jgi:hypothetical protein
LALSRATTYVTIRKPPRRDFRTSFRNSQGPLTSPGTHPGLGGASLAQVSRCKFARRCCTADSAPRRGAVPRHRAAVPRCCAAALRSGPRYYRVPPTAHPRYAVPIASPMNTLCGVGRCKFRHRKTYAPAEMPISGTLRAHPAPGAARPLGGPGATTASRIRALSDAILAVAAAKMAPERALGAKIASTAGRLAVVSPGPPRGRAARGFGAPKHRGPGAQAKFRTYGTFAFPSLVCNT